MNATKMELEVLQAIVDSDFHDGCDPVGNPVWADCLEGDCKTVRGLQLSGVVSSLNKKCFAVSQRDANEAVIHITQAGMDVLTHRNQLNKEPPCNKQ